MESQAVQFRDLLRRLKQHEVDFVIIGGVAAGILGSSIATFDLDVCASLDDVNLARILAALKDLHPRWRLRPDIVIPVDSLENFRGFKNLYIATDWGIIDVLGDLPEVSTFEQVKARANDMDVGGFTCPVIDIDMLIAAKRVAGRDKDFIAIDDLEAIKKARGL
jgi:hypothetical protein